MQAVLLESFRKSWRRCVSAPGFDTLSCRARVKPASGCSQRLKRNLAVKRGNSPDVNLILDRTDAPRASVRSTTFAANAGITLIEARAEVSEKSETCRTPGHRALGVIGCKPCGSLRPAAANAERRTPSPGYSRRSLFTTEQQRAQRARRSSPFTPLLCGETKTNPAAARASDRCVSRAARECRRRRAPCCRAGPARRRT